MEDPKGKNRKFSLTIPLDASSIGKDNDAQEVKLLARNSNGELTSVTTKLSAGGTAKVEFKFAQRPGPLQLVVGPSSASDEELLGLQTLSFNITPRKWGDESALELAPVIISPYYWHWWWRWCRSFVIRGRVICPDGNPVPGAQVCVFDVDRFFIWHSTQQIGCVTTDIDGSFELEFRWCCGWWPWWWLRRRVWQLDDVLQQRVGRVFEQLPGIQLPRIENQPSLGVFEHLTGERTTTLSRALRASDLNRLAGLRDTLLERLPRLPEIDLHPVWPWHPWAPWWDCSPDIIFRVTQDCEQPNQLLLDETVSDTRWNIAPSTDVTLIVDDNACCRANDCPNPPCDELECLVLDRVCGYPFSQIGGNLGAPGFPVGYANAGPVPADSSGYHRPFGGVLPIHKNPEYFSGIDYYEIEVFDDDPTVLDWVPLPPGAEVNFSRRYWDFTASPPSLPAAFNVQLISGHKVVETRAHYETAHPLKWPNEPGPGATTAVWLSQNYSLLLPLDSTKFPDGTYRFRVVGWQESGGALHSPSVLPVCGNNQDNEFVLTFDNRVLTTPASHNPAHNCQQGVHLCTTEPDTHILAVRINGIPLQPCDTVGHEPGGLVEIDFLAEDADQHLGYYVMESSWGLSQSRNLLEQPGASVVPLIAGTPTGWAPGQDTGNYGTALTQGATAPHWSGGRYRLTLPLEQAFPDPCCYQLELRAYKRSIVGYGSGCHNYHVPVNGNRTEYSLGVGVCP